MDAERVIEEVVAELEKRIKTWERLKRKTMGRTDAVFHHIESYKECLVIIDDKLQGC